VEKIRALVYLYIIYDCDIENGGYSFYSLYFELAFHKYTVGKIVSLGSSIVTLKFLEKYDKYPFILWLYSTIK